MTSGPRTPVRVGRTNVEVTRLGLGSAEIGGLYTALSDEQAVGVVDRAWESGVRYFDTAPLYGYGTAERRFGMALAGRPRDEFTVSTKVGRLVFNGYPTGVEVCPSMQHGGPWPATTDGHFTSVGTAAIERWVRPVAWQNFPQDALPAELRNKNERKLWRIVDGKITQDDA